MMINVSVLFSRKFLYRIRERGATLEFIVDLGRSGKSPYTADDAKINF